jgi:hypothetical protein
MEPPPKRSIKGRILRLFSWITGISIGSLLFILIAALIALAIFVRTATFQNALRDRVLQVARSELGASITFESATVSLFRLEPKIDFSHVKFEHSPTHTLADVQRISIGMSLFFSIPLLAIRELHLSSIEIEGLKYQLKDFKVVQKWLDQLRPKYGFIPPTFQTSVGRLGFRNVSVEVDLSEEIFYSRGLRGVVQLESVDLNLRSKMTEFSGSFTLHELVSKDWGPLDGSLSIENGAFNSSALTFENLVLKSEEDFLSISGGLKRWDNPILDLRGKVSARMENYFPSGTIGGNLQTDLSVRGPWNKLEGEGHALIQDFRVKAKHWENADAKWALKYPLLELKSLTWASGGERGEVSGTIPLESNEPANLEIKLENLELGSNLGIVAPGLIKWRGQTSGNLRYEGSLYPEIRGKFESKLHILNYQIRSPSHDTYTFGLPELQLDLRGNLDGIQSGDFSANLSVLQSKWAGGGHWSSTDFDLEWDAVFRGEDFGELLQKKLKLSGALKGSLIGPWRDLVMKVEPRFEEFSLNGKTVTNVKGNLVLRDRILAGAPLISDQVTIVGGIHFMPVGPDEYSNVRLESRNLDMKFLMDILGVREGWPAEIGAKVSLHGFLKGPLSEPIGSGDISLQDWVLKSDQTRGRRAKAKWATAGSDIYLDAVEIRFGRESEPLIGEMSFDSKGLVDLAIESEKTRISDLLYVFELNSVVQGFAELSLDYQRNSPSLKTKIRLFDTTVSGLQENDSDIRFEWVGNRMDFRAKLFGEAIQLSGVSNQTEKLRETTAKFNISNFNLGGLSRTVTATRMEVPMEGSGSLSFSQVRNPQENLLHGLFSEAGDYRGNIRITRANLQRGTSVLQAIDPFEVKMSGTRVRLPRFEFPSLKIRSAERLLTMKGYFQTSDLFSMEMLGDLDLRAMATLYPLLARSEGFASVNGVWDTRGFVGRFEVTQGLITFQNSPLLIRNVEAKLKSEGSRVELTELRGDFREGSLQASGQLALENKEIQSADVAVQLQNTLIQPRQGVSFRTSGPLNLKIRGTEGNLTGRLSIREGFFRRRLDIKADLWKLIESDRGIFKTAEEEAFWKKWKLNVLLVTDDPFNVRNNLAEGSANLNLSVLGTIGEPRLKGSIGVVRGDFYYHNRAFNITSGTILFSEQMGNIPSFDIRANTEVGEYRIAVQILGDANDQKIKYSSDPPLSEKDILTLVSFGYRASDTEIREQDPARSASFTGISFVTGQLQDKIEGGLSQGLGIRRFQLVPSYYDRTGKTELQLTVGTDLVRNKLEVNYSSFLSAVGGQKVELEYKVNRSVSLIGSWRNLSGAGTTSSESSDDFGGDIRFRFEFE